MYHRLSLPEKILSNKFFDAQGQGIEFDIFHDFRTSPLFKEKFFDHFKDLKLPTNFDVNLTSSTRGGMN